MYRCSSKYQIQHFSADNGELFGESLREDFMKSGDLSGFMDMRPLIDSDSNSDIPAPMQSMMQRNAPSDINMAKPFFAVPSAPIKQKRTDDEIILDKIHGVDDDDKPPSAFLSIRPLAQMPQPKNVAQKDGLAHGPKTRSKTQSISYQVIRGPTNYMVKTKTVVNSDGNSKITVERTKNGETKTETFINGIRVDGGNYVASKTMPSVNVLKQQPNGMVELKMFQPEPKPWIVKYGRHITINKDGYAMPKNLWWLEVCVIGSTVIASTVLSHALDVVVVVVVISLCLLNNIAFAILNEYQKLATNRHIEHVIDAIQMIATKSIHLKPLIKWCIHAHANISWKHFIQFILIKLSSNFYDFR